MGPIDWNKKVKQALQRTDIMALSTVGEGGSWTCPVHYDFGPKLELYFQSQKDTKHVANILKDARVSVAIYNPEALPDGGHMGLQIKGSAKLVSKGQWLRFEIIPGNLTNFYNPAIF